MRSYHQALNLTYIALKNIHNPLMTNDTKPTHLLKQKTFTPDNVGK